MHYVALRQLMSVSTLMTCLAGTTALVWEQGPLRVGSAAVELKADDSLVIGGSIGPGYRKSQEGQLRAVAIVLQGPPQDTRLAIVACDVLMIERDVLDDAGRQIEQETGIPFGNVFINCTHTHHAPTTVTVHGYERQEGFTQQVKRAIVDAVRQANAQLADSPPATAFFCMGQEKTIGQNSRMMLGDGTIYWIGARDNFVRPTGPFDPDLPVLDIRAGGATKALIFGHSTHTMGTLAPGKRSPAFYGLAAQDLEAKLGGTVLFLEGASGSTHNLTLRPPEMVERVKTAVTQARDQAKPMAAIRLASIKREFAVKIRHFDEEKEDQAVRSYCGKHAGKRADYFIDVFRKMRRKLADQQGQSRKTWLQAMRIGDVALVGVPAEFFTKLGMDIKRQSPFKHTIIAELANDWVGYVPDDEAYDLGGYQVWTGLHSYVARGTGEQMVAQVLEMLAELREQ